MTILFEALLDRYPLAREFVNLQADIYRKIDAVEIIRKFEEVVFLNNYETEFENNVLIFVHQEYKMNFSNQQKLEEIELTLEIFFDSQIEYAL